MMVKRGMGFYYFEKGLPQELNYTIDFRKFNKKVDFEDYLALFEDAGWKHISGTQNSGRQYFIPTSDQCERSIFSTTESALARYKYLYQVCSGYMACFMLYLTVVLVSCEFKLYNIVFLTPGLWERTGADFWRGFWFELPFVIFRIAPLIVFFITAIAFAIWAEKARKIYKTRTL